MTHRETQQWSLFLFLPSSILDSSPSVHFFFSSDIYFFLFLFFIFLLHHTEVRFSACIITRHSESLMSRPIARFVESNVDRLYRVNSRSRLITSISKQFAAAFHFPFSFSERLLFIGDASSVEYIREGGDVSVGQSARWSVPWNKSRMSKAHTEDYVVYNG